MKVSPIKIAADPYPWSVPREPFSFGGWNESRFGANDITGKSSIEFWTKLKKTTTKWNAEAGVNWMS